MTLRLEASQHLETCLTIGRRNGDIQALRMGQYLLAERDLLQGRPEVARARLDPLLDRPGLTELYVTELLPVLVEAEMTAGNRKGAERILTEAISRATAQNARIVQVDALRVRGTLLSAQRRWTDAEQTFEQALSLIQGIQYPYAEVRTRYELGLMQMGRDTPQQASQCASTLPDHLLRTRAPTMSDESPDSR